MNFNNDYIQNRLDYLEFLQRILLLKHPSHKASVFYDLDLSDFLEIRSFTHRVENIIVSENKYTIKDYENELFTLYPSLKSYPPSSTLIAKTLMPRDIFDSLFKYNN